MSSILSKLRRRNVGPKPDPASINYTAEHVSLAKAIARRRKVLSAVSARIPLIQTILTSVAVLWFSALPYEGLWKNTYIDEHALQPGQVTMYFDWPDVFRADRYLDTLETIFDATFEERTEFLQQSFSDSGLHTSNTSHSTYAHLQPPRSPGTEAILLSSNWVSRDGTPNLRGIAMLLSLADFLRGQNHWAFDFVFVIGEGYMTGLEDFMREYHALFPGVIWTALNVDYPGHSFSHLGLFYEGVNGRLPNQDVVNSVGHIAKWSGGVSPRLHDIDDDSEKHEAGPSWIRGHVGRYRLAGKHLLHHFAYAATGRASAAHGVLAKHRIDSLTLYATPSSGPHGFHTLGRTLESSLRTLNNLLERLHASYFFYLLPRPGKFIAVGQYLPTAILLGTSITIGGFDCPDPLSGLLWLGVCFGIGLLGWMVQSPFVGVLGLFLSGFELEERTRRSIRSLAHLLYGAMVPTLGMVNFPQAILLVGMVMVHLSTIPRVRGMAGAGLIFFGYWHHFGFGLGEGIGAGGGGWGGVDFRVEWEEYGNVFWVGVFVVWIPLYGIGLML